MATELSLTQAFSGIASLPDQIAAAVVGTLPAAAVRARGGVQQHFQTSTGPDGVPWKPLAHPRPAGGHLPLLDKGLLAASVTAKVDGDEIVLQASHPGARLHQFGGVVYPVRARALAIPISREATKVTGPRSFGRPLQLIPGRSGGPARLVEPGRGKGAPKTHFLLVRSVTVPKRTYLGFSAETLEAISEMFTEAAVNAAGGGA